MVERFVDNPILSETLWGNALHVYADAFVLFCVVGVVSVVIHRGVLRHIKHLATRTQTQLDDFFVGVVESISPFFYLALIAFVSMSLLAVPAWVDQVLLLAMIILGAWQIMRIVDMVITAAVRERLESRENAKGLQNAADILLVLVKSALWVTAGLLILSNLGVNITALVASVGIGGIAIAFAVKGILEDLFSSFSIYLDKPFVVGDTIAVDGEKGAVQRIGIKTTRLKSMATGEEIVMANTALTTQKIHNFHKMTKRRVSFDLGVTYETPTALLKQIPGVVEEIITRESGVEFSRAHFRSFEDSALLFSFLYYVNSREYDVYLETHQRILFAIREAFEERGIDMAYPTQTIHLQQ